MNRKRQIYVTGDSGGPTYIEADGKEYLTGITSRVPPGMPQQCGHGAVVTLPGAFSDLTNERYSALLKCRDEGDCSDVYDGNIGGGNGEGGNGEGGSGAGGNGEAWFKQPHHREPPRAIRSDRRYGLQLFRLAFLTDFLTNH